MKEIVEYKLAFGQFGRELSERVNHMIEKGWQPHGSAYKSKDRHYQPMVRYAKEKSFGNGRNYKVGIMELSTSNNEQDTECKDIFRFRNMV